MIEIIALLVGLCDTGMATWQAVSNENKNVYLFLFQSVKRVQCI